MKIDQKINRLIIKMNCFTTVQEKYINNSITTINNNELLTINKK